MSLRITAIVTLFSVCSLSTAQEVHESLLRRHPLSTKISSEGNELVRGLFINVSNASKSVKFRFFSDSGLGDPDDRPFWVLAIEGGPSNGSINVNNIDEWLDRSSLQLTFGRRYTTRISRTLRDGDVIEADRNLTVERSFVQGSLKIGQENLNIATKGEDGSLGEVGKQRLETYALTATYGRETQLFGRNTLLIGEASYANGTNSSQLKERDFIVTEFDVDGGSIVRSRKVFVGDFENRVSVPLVLEAIRFLGSNDENGIYRHHSAISVFMSYDLRNQSDSFSPGISYMSYRPFEKIDVGFGATLQLIDERPQVVFFVASKG